MKKISEYMSELYEYNGSDELSKHLQKMEELGWKCVSCSYGSLRARFRKDCNGKEKITKDN